jgi:hypothetical protein
MAHDVSKITILVLLVLTILVSVLGTLTVMNTISSPVPSERKAAEAANSAGGYVSINIVRPQEPKISQATGQIALNIVK